LHRFLITAGVFSRFRIITQQIFEHVDSVIRVVANWRTRREIQHVVPAGSMIFLVPNDGRRADGVGEMMTSFLILPALIMRRMDRSPSGQIND